MTVQTHLGVCVCPPSVPHWRRVAVVVKTHVLALRLEYREVFDRVVFVVPVVVVNNLAFEQRPARCHHSLSRVALAVPVLHVGRIGAFRVVAGCRAKQHVGTTPAFPQHLEFLVARATLYRDSLALCGGNTVCFEDLRDCTTCDSFQRADLLAREVLNGVRVNNTRWPCRIVSTAHYVNLPFISYYDSTTHYVSFESDKQGSDEQITDLPRHSPGAIHKAQDTAHSRTANTC